MRITTIMTLILGSGLTCGSVAFAASTKDDQVAMAALQHFNDFIGSWTANGESKTGKSEFWKENLSWGWKFNKNAPATLQVEFKDDKTFSKGEMKYLVDKKLYQLTMTDVNKKTLVFEGKIVRRALELIRIDESNKDKYTLRMSSTNEGALMNLEYMLQTGGKGLDKKLYVVMGKKDGVSISGGKKNECIVSGGVGTIAVSYNGKTYYVCCGGCRDAFNENPKKIVDEYLKKKK